MLSIADASANESDGGMAFVVTLLPAFHATVTLNYATIAATASNDDFTAATGGLSFAPGETSKTVMVSLIADELYEDDEQFYLRLSNFQQATFAGVVTGQIQATGTIVATGGAPLLGITTLNLAGMANEGEDIIVKVETILSNYHPGPAVATDLVVYFVASEHVDFLADTKTLQPDGAGAVRIQ